MSQRIYMNAKTGLMEGGKMRKAVYVVPVGVANQQVYIALVASDEFFPQLKNTRTSVYNQARFSSLNLYARCVAAVASSVWGRHGE